MTEAGRRKKEIDSFDALDLMKSNCSDVVTRLGETERHFYPGDFIRGLFPAGRAFLECFNSHGQKIVLYVLLY